MNLTSIANLTPPGFVARGLTYNPVNTGSSVFTGTAGYTQLMRYLSGYYGYTYYCTSNRCNTGHATAAASVVMVGCAAVLQLVMMRRL